MPRYTHQHTPVSSDTSPQQIKSAKRIPWIVIDIRYYEWTSGLEMLRKVKLENGMMWVEGPVLQELTNALARDERCFYFDRLPQDWKDLQLQLSAEQARSNAIGPDMKPAKVVAEFKVAPFPDKVYRRNVCRKMDGMQFDARWLLLFVLHSYSYSCFEN
jgi:hypothetical protein